MAILTQACTRSSPRGPSSIEPKPTLSPSSHSNIEQQLLKTVEGAERLGKGNPLVLSSLYSLATYYRSQQQYDKAEEQYQKALQIKEELSGPDHPDIVIILNNYANLLREAKRYAEAESLASRAATILTKNSPPLSTKPRSK
ncbi:MAG: tetratricopeptide repeat protein [Nitrospirales bacterium]